MSLHVAVVPIGVCPLNSHCTTRLLSLLLVVEHILTSWSNCKSKWTRKSRV